VASTTDSSKESPKIEKNARFSQGNPLIIYERYLGKRTPLCRRDGPDFDSAEARSFVAQLFGLNDPKGLETQITNVLSQIQKETFDYRLKLARLLLRGPGIFHQDSSGQSSPSIATCINI